MEYTDKYVFISPTLNSIDANLFRIDLGPTDSRKPITMVEVISGGLNYEPPDFNFITLKCDQTALNYFSSDLKGSVLANFEFNVANTVGPSTDLTLSGFSPKLVLGGEVRHLNLYFELEGNTIPHAEVGVYGIVLKVSYPVTGSIQSSFSSQIPSSFS